MKENWKEQARAHWKQFRPKLYRDLMKAGQLEAALDDAVERTSREMADLQRMGYDLLPKLPASSFLHDAIASQSRTIESEHHPINTVEQLKKALKASRSRPPD